MKLLQWQKPAKRWVLKTPHHLEFLDLVDKYFNDVQFIWTHRNVQEAIPSYLSMIAYSRAMFSDEVSAQEVANHWVKKIGYMLTRALEYREKNNHIQKFIDVSYQDLVEDNQNVMKRIYSNRNSEITSELQQIFENSERTNPKGKYGIHKYHLKDFGIDEDFIDKYTKEYQLLQEELLAK